MRPSVQIAFAACLILGYTLTCGTAAAECVQFTRDFQLHDTHEEVAEVQKFLNTLRKETVLAPEGDPGSPGNETNVYADQNFRAVARFQKLYKLPTDGLWNAATRAKANELKCSIVVSSALFTELKGFARSTTGGLGGKHYVVTSPQDYDEFDRPIPGTLRYGLETAAGPIWISFDPDVFNVAGNTKIALARPLRPHWNTTIDGSGAKVVLVVVSDWVDYLAKPILSKKNAYSCAREPWASSRQFVGLGRAQNVIINQIIFERVELNTQLIAGINMDDKECFGDVIGMSSKAGRLGYDRIWINHAEFSNCGDGCIDITRPSADHDARLTVSNSLFHEARKTMLVGAGSPPAGGKRTDANHRRIKLSVYNNAFVGTSHRNPRVTAAIAHVYNNLYKGWKGSGIGVNWGSVLLIEQNVFAAGKRKTGAIHYKADPGEEPSTLLAQDNKFINGAVPYSRVPSARSRFPAASAAVKLSSFSAARAEAWIFGRAGWKAEAVQLTTIIPEAGG